MHPADCPQWEYGHQPNRSASLVQAITSVLIDLRTRKLDSLASVSDTKHVHHRFFNQLTPPGYDYFAGNYRGSEYRCLKHYEVCVRGDPRVGFSAHTVNKYMAELRNIVTNAVFEIDARMKLPDDQLSLRQKVSYLVAATCWFFEIFLRIHPYANGNGHIGRFCVWALLGRYGFWPRDWPIEPRPADPPYTALIQMYRDGNTVPLEQFVMSLLVRN